MMFSLCFSDSVSIDKLVQDMEQVKSSGNDSEEECKSERKKTGRLKKADAGGKKATKPKVPRKRVAGKPKEPVKKIVLSSSSSSSDSDR